MGIRGLTPLLKKSALEKGLACYGSQCDHSPGVVIDGPGLAYWIYACLVGGFGLKGKPHTRPSFDLIRRMTLEFLEMLGKSNSYLPRSILDLDS